MSKAIYASCVTLAGVFVLVWLVAAIYVILERPVDAKPPPPPPVTPWLTMTKIVKPTMTPIPTPTPTPVARIYFPWIVRGCLECVMKGAGNE